jgi:uncharacterized protein (DUF58 family)
LDSLRNLELIARAMVEGSLTGLPVPHYHGFSSEFSEYRKYCPGDAVKHVDWVAYAKTDRLLRQAVRDETNTRAYIVLDRSAPCHSDKPRTTSSIMPVTLRRLYLPDAAPEGRGWALHLHRPH